MTSRNTVRLLQGIIRYLLFFAGLLFLSIGVVMIMQAGLGVNSWDVLHIGLANHSHLSVGAWIEIVGITMIFFTCLYERKLPQIGSILNIVLIGYLINLFLRMNLIPHLATFWSNLGLLMIGVLLSGFGAGMYVSSSLGAGPRDGLTLLLSRQLKWSIGRVRTILEGIALFFGWMLGGPVSIGTLISAIFIGPIIQVSLKFWRKQMDRIELVSIK